MAFVFSDAVTKALHLLIQGKRHVLVSDFSSAVQSLGEACELLDATYGKEADECGEAYLFYGIALLELSRQETGALDGVVNVKKEEKAATTTDAEEDIVPDSSHENSEKEAEAEKIDNAKACSSAEVDVNNAGPSQPSTSKAEDEENGEEAEISDLEISFDVLTMASKIFRRQKDKGSEMKLKLAECLQKLGEVSIEWENNELAVSWLGECLELRKECLPEDDRLIAETYYHIGIAHSFMSQVEKANDCYRSAIDVIIKRIESRKKIQNESSDTELSSKAETEIWELESLLPEMRAKIEDSQDQMLSTINDAKKKEESEMLEERMVAEKIKEVQAKPVNNVTHLVKRKRKEDSDTSPAAKKNCSHANQESLDNKELSEIKN
ncbi:Tetratricopeptide repeat containing protein 3-like protein [Leptotrombidium deliense]|uniref:Tetratricopeptide repeat containing protein 3-like protein n=1 Tax=Leptotrombidium deliense TaxID=299467 RepID=A0A443SAR6_9ACAR|nr:Tetratricopeptide repeat containing protein 3-like protein [Leptotrombidium deliense]